MLIAQYAGRQGPMPSAGGDVAGLLWPIVFWLVVWSTAGYLVGRAARGRPLDGAFLAVLLGPLGPLLIGLIADHRMRCPLCGGTWTSNVAVSRCRHCGGDLSHHSPRPASTAVRRRRPRRKGPIKPGPGWNVANRD